MSSDLVFLYTKAHQFDLLDRETELMLARRWVNERDEEALHQLVHPYLRLAIKWARSFARRYRKDVNDCLQEASIGMMHAAKKFDPDMEVPFGSYALWWIKAALQEFVMRDVSIVRIGTTSAQKSLFFNFKRARYVIERQARHAGETPTEVEILERVADVLGVPITDVFNVAGRLMGDDLSLDVPVSEDGTLWLDWLVDDNIEERDLDQAAVRGWLEDAFSVLTDRERTIVWQHKYRDPPATLEELGDEFNITGERVRQIEQRALQKMRSRIRRNVSKGALRLELM